MHQIWIQGTLTGNDYIRIKDDLKEGDIELHFDSAGGCVLGVDELAEAIYSRRANVRSYIHGACTSAAYWIACAASKVYICGKTTIVGSIGVKIEHSDMSNLLEKQGIKVTEIATGENKTLGSESRPLLDEEKGLMRESIEKLYDVFVKFVSKCRGIDESTIRGMQAKEFIGLDSITNKPVDGLIIGDTIMDIELLQKENEQLKQEIESLKKKLEELLALQMSAEGEEMVEEKVEEQPAVIQAERHRIFALMSLNKGGISDSIVSNAIAKGWNYGQTLDAITAKLSANKSKFKAASQIAPQSSIEAEKAMASLIAKGK